MPQRAAYVHWMPKSKSTTFDDSLTGRFLIAMPQMGDPRFARSVVFLCAHGDEGAMGLIVNKVADGVGFDDLLDQLGIEGATINALTIHNGGPVETGRGFVLHSRDYFDEGSVGVTDNIALTATIEVLRAIAQGGGPRKRLLALGYAGWGEGQLESEIQANGWLIADADEHILFDEDLERKWDKALAKLGVDPAALSGASGRA